jgi:hypothetical protein
MSRLTCRFGVKIASPKSVVFGSFTPRGGARPLAGLRLVSLDATRVATP